MANNIDDERIKSLKASFCRQQFPSLLQFLQKFDISEHSGRTPSDSLNMHFLLQAYDHNGMSSWIKKIKDPSKQKEQHQQEISTLKETCKWSLSNVDEKEVLQAVNEYFEITSRFQDIRKNRNALVEKSIISGNSKKEWKFEDDSTYKILGYFGINPSKTELGFQRLAFSMFVRSAIGLNNNDETPEIYFDKDYFDKYEELGFTNAFHLLRSLRNWGGHGLEEFNEDEKSRYYLFILFTHIGITYVCRRIWNKYGKTLLNIKKEGERKYKEPCAVELEKDKVSIYISDNSESKIISKCEYRIEGQKKVCIKDKGTQIKFDIEVPKYTPFTIKFRCEQYVYEITRSLSYYFWDPTLTISIQPPAKIHCACRGIAGNDKSLEDIISNLLTKYLGTFSNSEATEKHIESNNEIKESLAKIEPLLREARKLSDNNNKEINEIQGKLKDVEKQLEELDENLKPIYGSISDTTEGVKILIDILNTWENNFRGIAISIFLLVAVVWSFLCYKNNFSTNMFWLKHRGVLLIISIAITYFSFRLLTNTWNPLQAIKTKGKLKYCIPAIILLLFVSSPLLLKYPTMSSLAIKYDFAKNKLTHNQEVISLLENYLDKNQRDDDVIVQLAKYYLNYAGEDDRAWEILQPMLKDPEVHKQHLVTIAETYFAKGSYKEVYDIVNRCKDLQVPAILRLEGLLYATPAVNMLDYQKGDSLLKLAARQGDTEAYYWLGHIRSNAAGSWRSTYQGGEKLFSLEAMDYDLVASIAYLRQAAAKGFPKAALELGNIFSDLIINDSAQVYYEKALANSDRNIKKEVYYRLGLLDEQRGDSLSKNLQTAIDFNYGPALLHKAMKSGSSSILYVKKMEERNGDKSYGYIPSIVFRYFNKDLRDSAMISLKQAHPDEIIDDRFFDAIEAIYSDDSLANKKGRQMIRTLSDHNKFSQMLTLYWDLKAQISTREIDIQSVNKNIAALERIGKDLPFAYALAAFILKEMGPSHFDESDKFAQKAIISGHPAGAVVLAYIPASYFDKIEEMINAFYKNGHVRNNLLLPWSKERVAQLIKIRNKIHLALRMSLPNWFFRSMFINYGQKIDYILYSMTKEGKIMNDTTIINTGYPEENLRFWSNVAMGIHDFENEGWMVYQYFRNSNSNIGLYYVENLIESMLRSVYFGNQLNTQTNSERKTERQIITEDVSAYLLFLKFCKGDTTFIKENLAFYLSEMPEAFRDEMKEKYDSDNLIRCVLETKQPVNPYYILGTNSFNGNEHIWFDNDRDLLEEWRAVYEGRRQVVSIR